MPPVITSKFGTYYLNYSSEVNLACESTGNPAPDITWYKDNRLLLGKHQGVKEHQQLKYEFSNQTGSLTIFDLNSNDEGIYYCYASSLDIFPVSSLNYTIKGKYLLLNY